MAHCLTVIGHVGLDGSVCHVCLMLGDAAGLDCGGDVDGDDEVVVVHHRGAPRVLARLLVIELAQGGEDVDRCGVTFGREVVEVHAVIAVVFRLGQGLDSGCLVGGVLDLVGIPVGGQIREVDHFHVRAVAFYFLGIPEGEGVVVTVGEYDTVFVNGVKVVHAEVACHVAA